MKKTFLLLLLSLCFIFVQAQNEVTIGTASSSNSISGPTYIDSAGSTYLWSNHISVFTPAEIGSANISLSGFSWKKSTIEGYNLGNAEFRIYVKHTSSTSIPTTSGTFATEIAGATLVYESISQNLPLDTAWVDFDCNTANSFIYNGTDNLMILVDWYRPGAPTSGVNWFFTIKSGMAQTWAGPSTPPTISYSNGCRPNIKIRYIPVGPNVSPSSITMNCGDTAVFTASGSTGFYQWYSDSLGLNSIGSDSILHLGPLCSDATVYVAAIDKDVIYNFTNCGATGPTGPTQTEVNTAYASTNLDGDITINTQGIQEWIVPQTGVYTIEAYGAQGGPGATYDGGNGAYMNGDFSLTLGDTLLILVGQMGIGDGTYSEFTGGGGGGSFIATGSNLSTSTPLLIAGGGGGSSTNSAPECEGMDAVTTQDGTQDGEGYSVSGINGNGGEDGCSIGNSGVGGGGAGFYTNGVNLPSSSSAVTQGFSFVNGGEGAANTGGFGGGGGNDYGGNYFISGSGGGGYSGGAGGNRGCLFSTTRIGGGGGGSYNAGTSQINTAGINTGHGSISISLDGTGVSSILVPAQITILPISDSVVTPPISICEMDSVLLTATGSTGNYLWSADSLGNTLLENGPSYQTGAVLSGTVFYVQAYSDSINQTYSFTNCAVTGRTGPTQANVDAAYSASLLNGNVNITTQGIQEWIVPYTATYSIEVAGAQGGGDNGGLGANMQGDFMLTEGDTLKIVVGQEGAPVDALSTASSSGGGGSFVVLFDNTPLIIAGGGGGNQGTTVATSHGAILTSGQTGYGTATVGPGGVSGNGGTASPNSGGGGGLLTNGTSGTNGGTNEGGHAFLNGGEGGIGNLSLSSMSGGFGGGGSATNTGWRCGGGGGGYSGGGGGNVNSVSTDCAGGGGGSYNNGTNQNNTAGINTGHGYVTIKVYAPLCYSSIIPVNLTTDSIPEVTTQAVNAAIFEGSNAGFSITATGTALNYQWQESTDSSTSWTNLANIAMYSGVTTAMLTITSTTIAMDNYYYRCIVDGTCSPSDTSTNAILEVQSTAGINSYAINGINVYPNPVENTLIIEIDSKIEDNANLSIYDIIGNAILEYPDISITIGVNRIPVDVQTLAKGVYYLRVLIGQEQLQYSIIKK
jgi:Secretion system C-terminal sorting domain/Ig-like domain CHU_C associated